jgi:hypothetical protein
MNPERKENGMVNAMKVAALFLAVLVPALFAAGCAGMRPAGSVLDIPYPLRPGANEALAMIAAAQGVQIYECRAGKDGGAYEWRFVAPEADLYNAQGAKVGHHYAGPHWESADGSRVVGTVKASAGAPAAGAIPWLLLAAKSDGPKGSLSNVTSVLRVHTSGGEAPAGGCSQASAGTQVRVDYSADYYFYAPLPPMAFGAPSLGY